MLRHDIPITATELKDHVSAWLKANRGPTNTPFEPRQAELLKLLASHLGQASAASLDFFASSLEAGPGADGPLLPGARGGVSDRELKQLVRDLRLLHRIKVGSLRGWRRVSGKNATEGPRGYFLCLTAADVLATFGPRLHEALATLEVCDALTDGRLGLARMLAEAKGQLRLFEETK